jgi:hypothetical protein
VTNSSPTDSELTHIAFCVATGRYDVLTIEQVRTLYLFGPGLASG